MSSVEPKTSLRNWQLGAMYVLVFDLERLIGLKANGSLFSGNLQWSHLSEYGQKYSFNKELLSKIRLPSETANPWGIEL